MAQVFSYPADPVAFDNAAEVWQLKAGNTETATITITIGAGIDTGNRVDYRMFVEIFDGNDIEIRHGATVVGSTGSAGDTNGSQTAANGGQEITITSEGPCHHIISSFTFDVNPN